MACVSLLHSTEFELDLTSNKKSLSGRFTLTGKKTYLPEYIAYCKKVKNY